MINTSQQQFIDSIFGVRDLADPSKLGQFDASAISAGVARVLAFPNASGTIALEEWVNDNFLSLDGEGSDVVNGTFNLTTTGLGTFAGMTLTGLTENALMRADSSGVLTSLAAATDGQLIIGSTGAAPSVAALTGTANQIIVTPGAGSITLSTPQDIHAGASPTFAGLTITNAVAMSSDSVVFQPDTDATDFFQILNAAGTTCIFNADTTKGRIGMGIDVPARQLHIAGDTNWLRLDRNHALYGPVVLFVKQNEAGDTIESSWIFGPTNTAGNSGNDFAIVDLGIAVGGTGGDSRFVIDKTTGDITISEGLVVNTDLLVADTISGNVGIGTASPLTLDAGITTEISSATGAELILTSTDVGIVDGQFIAGLAFKSMDSSGDEPHYCGIKARANGVDGAMDLEFYSGRALYELDTPVMVFDPDGFLKLISTANQNSQMKLISALSNSITEGELIGGIDFLSNDNNDEAVCASIKVYADTGNQEPTDYNTRMVFSTTLLNETTPTIRMTIKNDGKVGVGASSPNAPLEVKGLLPGEFGGFQSGLLHVTAADNSEFANSVITGHNSFSGNTQLWYLGSTSGSNNDVAFINRQNGSMAFRTNDTERFKIEADGTTHIGDGTNETRISATGDLSFYGTAGLIFGHMDVPAAVITVDTIADGNPVEVKDDGTGSADDGWETGELNGTVFAVSDLHYITITIAGTYKVPWGMSVKTAAGAGTEIHGGIMIDGVAVRNNGEGHAHVFNANDDINLCSIGVIDCPNGNEEISLWVSSDQNQKTIVEHGNMYIEQIGGT